MGLAEDLVARPQRENAGARSRNRSGYQESWSLCKLLELHEGGNDYLLVCEYHDDVIVLDSSTDPSSVDFYQVKTRKNGNWTRSRLLQRRMKKPSILGLLYGNYLAFATTCKSLNVISNMRFKLDLGDGSESLDRRRMCLDEANATEIQKIEAALEKEHSLTKLPGGLNLTFLEACSLSVDDHENNALGRLASFVGTHHPKAGTALQPLFRSLQAEVRRRSAQEDLPTDFQSLASSHGISRTDFDTMIGQAETLAPGENVPARIEERLNSEGVTVGEALRLVRCVKRYLAERLDPNADFLQSVQEAASGLVPAIDRDSLIEIADAFIEVDDATLAEAQRTYGPDYLRAIAMVAFYEQDEQQDNTLQVPQAGSTSADQEK